MNILLSQGDFNISTYIKRGLREAGYRVETSNDGDETTYLLNMNEYDLLIIEAASENINGIEVCQKLKRKNKRVRVIFLSELYDIDLKIKALDSGGDDYIVKPFDFRELLARIRAILRRTEETGENILTAKDLTLNLLNREVKRSGVDIELTLKEFVLLEYLMRNKNLVLTRTVIKEKIWNIDFLSDTNIVDVYITHLREKIDKKFTDKLIHTVRGVGYVLKA